MRLFLALLLCLAIPLQGWAAGASVQTPCPMEAAMALPDGLTGIDGDMPQGDCCNDVDTARLTGQLCKAGQECPAPTGWVAPPAIAMAQALPLSDLLAPVPLVPPRGAPASIWRPPSLL
jgi:hypothetical protein